MLTPVLVKSTGTRYAGASSYARETAISTRTHHLVFAFKMLTDVCQSEIFCALSLILILSHNVGARADELSLNICSLIIGGLIKQRQ